MQIEVSFSRVGFDPSAELDERHPASLAKEGGRGGEPGGRPSVFYLTNMA